MKTRTSLILLALAVLALVAVQPARAATIYWDEGGGNKSWNTATNWSDNTLPNNANEYVLDDSLIAMTATYGLDADFTIQTLTLNSAAMTDLNADTVGAVARTLTLNGGTGNPLIAVGNSANAAVNIGVAAGVGTLGITLAGSGDIDVANAKTLTIKSVINESGSQSLRKTSAGTLVLSGANLYTGTTTVNAGILRAGSTTAFGPAANASLVFGAGSTGTVQLNGNSMTVIGLNTNTTVGTPIVENNAAGAATLTINNTTANTFAGVIRKGAAAGNLLLTKTGAGLLTLTGNSGAASIGGVVQVNAGSMEISGGGFLYSGTNTTSSIGTGAADSNIAVTIIGTGTPASSTWRNSGSIRVGLGGDNNTLTVSAGGRIWAGGGTDNISIGYNNGSDNNTITVTGSGSSLNAEDYLEVGRGGAGNTLNIENGATASCFLFWSSGGTGNPTGSSNSTVKVDGAGSSLSVTGTWDIGDRGTGNQFKVLNGGVVNMAGGAGYVAYYTGDTTLLVDGTNSVFNTAAVDWANGGSSAPATVSNGGRWNANGTITFRNNNNLNLNSGGELNVQTLNLAAAGGRLNFNGGRLIAQSSGSLVSGSGQINLIGAGYIKTDYARTIGVVIYGAGGPLTKEGTGVLTLSGLNTYTGTTTISTGTLKLGAAGTAPNGPLGTTAAGTTVSATGAALDLGGFTLVTAEALTLNGTGVSSGGALTNSSATAATYSGLITLGSASSIVASSGNIVISNAGTITGSGFGLTLDGTAAGSSLASIIGTDAGTLTKSGTGTWTLTGANTYTGATTITAGTLSVGADANLGNANSLVFDGGTLQVTGTTLTTFGTHTPTFNDTKTVGLDINNAANTFTVSQVLNQGTGGLTKAGAGTLVLTGTNGYTGATTISAGTLLAKNTAALPNYATQTIAVNGTSTLAVNAGLASPTEWDATEIGNLLGNANVTFAAGTIFAIDTTGGNLNYAANITKANMGLTKLGANTLVLSGAGSNYSGATTVKAGTLTVTNGTLTRLDVPGGTANLNSPASALAANVSGGQLNLNGNVTNTLKVTSGTVTVGSGATVGTADFSTGTGTVNATIPLAVTNVAKWWELPNKVTVTGTSPFTLTGTDVVHTTAPSHRTLTASGGVVTVAADTACPTSGLVGRWTFDDGTASDSSGNGYNGTLVANPTFSSSGGVTGGQAITLDGSTQYVKVDTGGSQTVFDGGSAMTASVWIKGVGARWCGFVSKGGDAVGGGYWVGRMGSGSYPGKLGWYTYSPAANNLDFANDSNAKDGNWHMVTVTYDANGSSPNKKIYLDSVLIASTTLAVNIAATTDMLAFGADQIGGVWQKFYGGSLDDIYFYNRALTPTEVAQLYTPTPASNVDLSTTDLAASSTSGVSLPLGVTKLGNLSLSGSGTALTLSGTGATGASFDQITAADTSSIAVGLPISVRTGNVAVSGGKTLTVGTAIVDGTSATALNKLDNGTLLLTGANLYTGNTTISNGTLALTGSIANSPVIDVALGSFFDVSGVGGGYTLGASQTLKGKGTVTGPMTAAGTVSPGYSTGTLTVTGDATLNGTFSVDVETGGASDLLAVTGNLALGGASILSIVDTGNLVLGKTYTIATYGTQSGTFFSAPLPVGWSVDYGPGISSGAIKVVPEPATLVLLGLGGLGLILSRKRR